MSTFAAQSRKVGRVIECAGLEIRYTPCGYRGFESLTFRKKGRLDNYRKTKSIFAMVEKAEYLAFSKSFFYI